MTTEDNNQSLASYVRTRRESLGLDYYEAAERSGLDHTFWRKLEAGVYGSPSPRSLEGIARALEVGLEDLYLLAGYQLSSRELPSFRPYLRARYHLPHEAVADLEKFFAYLRAYYAIPDDQPVFPPTPKSKPGKPRRPGSATPKRRAA